MLRVQGLGRPKGLGFRGLGIESYGLVRLGFRKKP